MKVIRERHLEIEMKRTTISLLMNKSLDVVSEEELSSLMMLMMMMKNLDGSFGVYAKKMVETL